MAHHPQARAGVDDRAGRHRTSSCASPGPSAGVDAARDIFRAAPGPLRVRRKTHPPAPRAQGKHPGTGRLGTCNNCPPRPGSRGWRIRVQRRHPHVPSSNPIGSGAEADRSRREAQSQANCQANCRARYQTLFRLNVSSGSIPAACRVATRSSAAVRSLVEEAAPSCSWHQA